MEGEQLHVVMFPFFAFGHISPFVRLSNEFCSRGFRVSFLTAPGNITRTRSSFNLSPHAQIIPTPIPAVEGLPPGLDSTAETTPAMAGLLLQALDLMKPQVATILSQLKPHFVFYDFAQPWIPELASPLGIKSVYFCIFAAISGAYLTVPERAELKNNPSVDKLKSPPKGFPRSSSVSLQTFQAEDFLYLFTSFDGGPCCYERIEECLSGCDAYAIKTCNEMEGPYVDYLKTQLKVPILLTGLLPPDPPSDDQKLEQKWSNWLAQFPEKSVIYCSFGSETFLEDEQIRELALGLELTNLPFCLVLNFPAGVDPKEKMDATLPAGFLDRVKGRGRVHSGWIQQQLFMAHNNVGCFLSHAGFSSVTEAIVNDCQMVLLPLKGDQFMVAKLVGGHMKTGVEVKRRDEDGMFWKEDVYDAIKTVILEREKKPGKSIRENHAKWREFLVNKERQTEYLSDLVKVLKTVK